MFKYRYLLTIIGISLALVAINNGYCQKGDDEARAESIHNEADALAKAAQNPVADLISVPFQNNTGFGIGPHNRTQNVLNIQPVIPVNLSEDWNLINRTIAPVIYQPFVDRSSGGMFGLGDINHTAFISPAKPGAVIWAAGPIVSFPTATDEILGSGKWSAGPSVAALTMQGPWVIGAIANNLWDFAGQSSRSHINQFLVQPFINYNIANGWYLVTAPIITANWKAESSERWIVPAGAGFGKVLMIGSQPINASAHGYYNVEKPDGAADWTLRLQIQLLFPTS